MLRNEIREKVQKGLVFKNPKKGISAVVNVANEYISYKRGKSNIQLPYSALEAAYEKFKGVDVATTDLKNFIPDVFDSKRKGHDCNCTFMFCLLQYLGYTVGDIQGTGNRGNAFHIQFKR